MRNPGCDQDVVFVRTGNGWIPFSREALKLAELLDVLDMLEIYDPNESLSEEKEVA